MEQDQPRPSCSAPVNSQPVVEVVSWSKYLLGVMLVILAGCAFTAANVVQKIVAPSLDFWSLLLHRSLVQMAIMAGHVACTTRDWLGHPDTRTKVFLQGVFGGLLLLAIFVAVKHVPLGNASAIFFCTPVATFLFASFMLEESFGLYRAFISLLMVTGVLLITRPPVLFPVDSEQKDKEEDGNLVGYMAAICVPILSAVVSIWTRQCRNVTASVLMFWFAAGAFIVAFGGIVFNFNDHVFQMTTTNWIFTFVIIALGMIGNMSYTFAVRWVSPSKANVFRSFEVILNYSLQILLEKMVFHPTDVAGIVMLLLAVVATGFETEVMARFLLPYL